MDEDDQAAMHHQQELERQEQEEMGNMDFWNRVKKTNPNRVKPISGKQYKGNSPQPYYLVERMTHEFGMCGIGWGLTIKNERMERLSDTDVLHVAVVEVWYRLGDEIGRIEQVGQTKASYMSSKGSLVVDEDAPKKSVTDAMTKCMSYLGFAGDIFSGQWDDNKYVAQLQSEIQQQEAEQQLSADLPTATHEIRNAPDMDALKLTFKYWSDHFKGHDTLLAAVISAKDQRKEQLTPIAA